MKRTYFCFLSSLMIISMGVNASEIFVSSKGNTKGNGLIENPVSTIKKALQLAQSGDEIVLRAGIYKEEINVSKSHLTIRNYPGEVAILDGSTLTPGKKQEAFILIENQSDIVIQGLTIRNYQSKNKNVVPMAIRVEGAGKNIFLLNNKIHAIKTTYSRKGSNAHAIAIYGTKAPAALENIVVENNELFDLKLGSSEALVVNGNVNGFRIAYNYIHHSNNIAIDAIGFEGSSPDTKYDQARNGVIFQNVIHAVSSRGNPAYGNSVSAGGIYVDGGRDIVIDSNTVYDSDIGIEIASEHKGKSTSNVLIRNNVLSFNRMAGVAMGGYDSARGNTENCGIINNTFYKNNSEDLGGEIFLQYYNYNNTIKNNVIVAGEHNKFYTNSDASGNRGNIIDSNLYFSDRPLESSFEWKNVVYKGLKQFKEKTKLDKNSIFANPEFEDESQSNLRLRESSPGINHGENLGSLLGKTDRDSEDRVQDGEVDLGAFEL